MTDQEIISEVTANVPLKQQANIAAGLQQSLSAGYIAIPAPAVPQGAAGGGALGAARVGLSAARTGLQLAKTGLKAVPILSEAIGGLDLLVNIKNIFTGAHAAAVRTENATLGTVVPQVNQAYAQVDEGFKGGKLNADQAAQALDTIENEYLNATVGILKEGISQCNAACVFHQHVIALNIKKKSQYASPFGSVGAFIGVGAAILAGKFFAIIRG